MKVYKMNRINVSINDEVLPTITNITARMKAIALSAWGYAGGGSKVATTYMVNYNGKLRRIYQDANISTNYAYSYILVKGKRITVKFL